MDGTFEQGNIQEGSLKAVITRSEGQVSFNVSAKGLTGDELAELSLAIMEKAKEVGGPDTAIRALSKKLGATLEKVNLPCNCINCTAARENRRKRNASDPNVN